MVEAQCPVYEGCLCDSPELLDEKMAAALIALHAAIRIPVLINNDKHIQRTPLARVILFGYSVVF